jgi:hypothetical protein
MKNKIMCLIIFVLFGCKEKSTEPVSRNQFKKGTYSGQYIYTQNGVSDTGTAEISFQDTSYNCKPLQTQYLLSGSGVYNVVGDTIEIKDLLVRVALYYTALVMNGKFAYSANGNRLVLIQESESKNVVKKFELTLTN